MKKKKTQNSAFLGHVTSIFSKINMKCNIILSFFLWYLSSIFIWYISESTTRRTSRTSTRWSSTRKVDIQSTWWIVGIVKLNIAWPCWWMVLKWSHWSMVHVSLLIHWLRWTDINVVRHSARLPTNIFTSHPHNAPGTLIF